MAEEHIPKIARELSEQWSEEHALVLSDWAETHGCPGWARQLRKGPCGEARAVAYAILHATETYLTGDGPVDLKWALGWHPDWKPEHSRDKALLTRHRNAQQKHFSTHISLVASQWAGTPLGCSVDILELGVRIANALDNWGIETLAALCSRSGRELLRAPRMGQKALKEIEDSLEIFKLSLCPEDVFATDHLQSLYEQWKLEEVVRRLPPAGPSKITPSMMTAMVSDD